LTDANAIPVLVHASARNAVDTFGSVLRSNGISAHCTWIPALEDLADGLEQLNPELLISVETPLDVLVEVASVRDQVAPSVPLIVLRDDGEQAAMMGDMLRGARDCVSLRYPERVAAVIRRELRAFRLERTLTNTLNVAQDYRQKLQTVLRSSKDAIAQVQEGIIVEVNGSWLELFAYPDSSALIGQPVMDFFEPDSQASLRGALAACARGRWSERPLTVGAMLADRSIAPLELVLSLGEHDGESSIQLLAPARRGDDRKMASDLAAAVHQDSATGLWNRRHLLEMMRTEIGRPIPGGSRFMVVLRPDRVTEIERDAGPENTDYLLTQFAAALKAHCSPNDLLGHFGGLSFAMLAQRGNRRDMEAWCASLVEKIARFPFSAGTRAVQLTCSVGAAQLSSKNAELGQNLLVAQDALRRAREREGNQFFMEGDIEQSSRMLAYDEVWVRHIKAALAENRFRLVQLPVASLNGDGLHVFDIAVRMLDFQGKDVLPTEFLPAAKRNHLLGEIDRWVLGAAAELAVSGDADLLFVRLSGDTIFDRELVPWMEERLRNTRANPARLCLQFTEKDALKYKTDLAKLLKRLKPLGVKLAIEHFGTQPEAPALLNALPLDYIKIDGSLMQGLSSDTELQEQVREIVTAAGRLNIMTVAERIEDANTMAVVFQLGVQYIQGYLINKPEEVVMAS
jgi:diguanylate cyclase (GGDEF)-like protein